MSPDLDLSGVHIPTITPFDDASGDVDLDAFGYDLRAWLKHPVRGMVVGGSTGEAVLLDEDERRLLWSAARETLGQDRLLIAGTGAESLRATLRMCRSAADAGADAVLVQPPAFYKGAMTPEALVAHYTAVADGSPVPVVLYQVPLRLSTLDFPTGVVAELARHDNVIGIKDSRGKLELVAELVEATRDSDFQVLVGNGALVYASLRAGAVGGILGVANLVPGECAAIVEAVGQGRDVEAGRLQEWVAPLHNDIIGGMGVPGVKHALDLLGLRGGYPRPPLRPLPQARREAVRGILAAAGLASD